MSNSNAIELINVFKKFKKGERIDSLRDFVPNVINGLFGRNGKDELHGKEFWAVKNVSFQLKKGEALGIIGPNGAGKSTILKILSRILQPTKGKMIINGKLSSLLEVGAGFHPDLTGRENIYLSGAIIGMKKREIEKKVGSIIEFSEIKDFIDMPVKNYSSGMYVRLGFSIAAHMNPDILLIDEVLAVGDYSFQNKCMRKINEIREKNVTIIFISHNLEFVRRLCPNSILLKNGEIKFYGKSQECIETYLISAENHINALESNNGNSQKLNTKILDVKLYNGNEIEKGEFATGAALKIKIYYSTKNKIDKPTFSVGFFSNGELFADLNSRFENHEINYIEGKGEIDVTVSNLLLLPGRYEARVYLSDKDALGIYDWKGVELFVKENKRGFGKYYQPHIWSNA